MAVDQVGTACLWLSGGGACWCDLWEGGEGGEGGEEGRSPSAATQRY